jgi:5'(3')-deoxyribonucleotidase
VGGIPFDKLIARYLLDAEFVASMPVVEGAVDAVKTIRGKYPTGVASSRPKETETETVKWLTDNFGMKADRFTNTTGTDKSLIDANILVDDYPPNLKSFIAKSRNRRGILFSQPWNTQHDEIAELIQKGSIVVRKSWEEIESLFQ